MPNDVIYALTQRHRVFNGTNAEDMLAAVQGAGYPDSYISASANYPGASATLQITTDTNLNNGPYPIDFTVGSSWGFSAGGMYPSFSMADEGIFVPLKQYVEDLATPIATAAASAAVAALPLPALAVGYAVTPNLIVGASATVTVPMVPSLPDAGYNVAVALSGSAQLLGALQILSATVVSASSVDVSVRNNGLLTLGGATVLVTALHNG